jgi:hypothetical protein
LKDGIPELKMYLLEVRKEGSGFGDGLPQNTKNRKG